MLSIFLLNITLDIREQIQKSSVLQLIIDVVHSAYHVLVCPSLTMLHLWHYGTTPMPFHPNSSCMCIECWASLSD